MLELSLLGLHALRGADGRELGTLPAQPKRFALLACLAIGAGGGYQRRDTLAAMFWPELDQFAARRALRNTLYHLREALGDGVIIVRGDDAVSIDAAALTCDVTRLAEAVDAGRYEEAVDTYRGELLAGAHFADAGEAFEEWLSRERARVVALVIRAIGALVEREERAGNPPVAAYWAQRACALAPDDEGWLRRAMSLLEQSSDTGGALRLYETYSHRLVAEFAATPSRETAALAARIRTGGRSPDPARPVAPSLANPIASPDPHAVHASRARRRAAGAVALALLGLLIVRLAWPRPAGPAGARARVLISVFDNRTGDSALQSLGRMTQDWLAQGVLRTRLIDVVDPRAVFVQARSTPADPVALARRTGATMVVSGSYDRAGDSLLVQATVMDVRTGGLIRVVGPIVSSVRTPLAAVAALRSRIMTALASVVDTHATQGLDPTDEIPPFDAYQAYVEGYDAFWHGEGRKAEGLFLEAAHRDTAFTAAALGAAAAAANFNDCPLVDSLTAALDDRHRALLRTDRLSLQIADARCRGRNEEMLRLTLERADLEPRSSGDQMAAAAAALWANRPARALELLHRVDPAVDLAWSADTTHFAYWSGVAEALHMLGRYNDELAVTDRLPPGGPLNRIWLRGNALAALSRPTAVMALLDSALTLPTETENGIGLAPYTDGRPQYTMTPGWVANWIARELAIHGDTVAARQAAKRAVAWYRSRPLEERMTVEERLVAAWSLEMLGAFPEAEGIARQLVAEDSANVDFRGELAGLAAELGDTALAGAQDRWLAEQPPARVTWTASVYRARLAGLLGRRDDAVARIRDAFDEGVWPRWLHQEPALDEVRHRADFLALTGPRD